MSLVLWTAYPPISLVVPKSLLSVPSGESQQTYFRTAYALLEYQVPQRYNLSRVNHSIDTQQSACLHGYDASTASRALPLHHLPAPLPERLATPTRSPVDMYPSRHHHQSHHSSFQPHLSPRHLHHHRQLSIAYPHPLSSVPTSSVKSPRRPPFSTYVLLFSDRCS
jgi:hypothetical protein